MSIIDHIRETEKEVSELDLDDPKVRLFRYVMLGVKANLQDSDLYCTHCGAHLPYTSMTVKGGSTISEDGYHQDLADTYFCTLCQKDFVTNKP